MAFDFNQAAKKRVKRATYAFMQAQKEYSRQKKAWGNKYNQEITSWNPAMQQAGENYCDAAVFLHYVYMQNIASGERGAQYSNSTMALLEAFADDMVKIIEKGVTNETSSRWRTNVLIGLVNKANTSMEIVIRRQKAEELKAQRTKINKSFTFK